MIIYSGSNTDNDNVMLENGRVGHKHYKDNYLSSPDSFYDPHTRYSNCCGTVRQNCDGILGDSENKTLKLKLCDIHARVVLTAITWKDKQDM
jgi:hypothetical protein